VGASSSEVMLFYFRGRSRYNGWALYLEFVVNNALRKIFDTKSQDIVEECREIFNCLSVESAIASRRWKFLEKLLYQKNKLCNIFVVNDTKELSEIRQSWLYNSVTVISC